MVNSGMMSFPAPNYQILQAVTLLFMVWETVVPCRVGSGWGLDVVCCCCCMQKWTIETCVCVYLYNILWTCMVLYIAARQPFPLALHSLNNTMSIILPRTVLGHRLAVWIGRSAAIWQQCKAQSVQNIAYTWWRDEVRSWLACLSIKHRKKKMPSVQSLK